MNDTKKLFLSNVRELLASLRENDWYITAFSFAYNNHTYAVVFEDLRPIQRGSKYFAACLTFIDCQNENRILETYANSYQLSTSDEEIYDYFEISMNSNMNDVKYGLFNFYKALNASIPSEYTKLDLKYKHVVLNKINNREPDNGLCCYAAKRNGRTKDGKQKKRTEMNTAKTKILRASLFDRLGKNDKTISFCYRDSNPLTDAEIIANFK